MPFFEVLEKARPNNVNWVVIGHLNTNSIRNKSDMLSSMIRDITDVFMVPETKPDSSFSQSQFLIKGYASPFRCDRN